jgi:LPXTG-motif cell wall-anchored protein
MTQILIDDRTGMPIRPKIKPMPKQMVRPTSIDEALEVLDAVSDDSEAEIKTSFSRRWPLLLGLASIAALALWLTRRRQN